MRALGLLAAIVLALTLGGAAEAASARKNASAAVLFAAAERGEPQAQTQVGFMYETGRGLPQDYMAAVYWYRRAAEQGYPRAMHLLGLMYDKGQGVAEDYVTAHKWLNLAAAGAEGSDREYFLRIRNAVAQKMTIAQQTEAQWLARNWRPMPEVAGSAPQRAAK
jgi:TPR repeat protein